MPPEELTVTSRQPVRRRAGLALVSVLVALLVVWVLVDRSGIAEAGPAGRVVTGTVTTRTLVATSEVDGTVQRALRYLVAYGSTGASLVPDAATGTATGTGTGTGKDTSSAADASAPSTGTAPSATSVSAPTSSAVRQVVFASVVAPTVDTTASSEPTPTPTPTPETTSVPTPTPTPTPTVTMKPTPTSKPAPTSTAAVGSQPTGGSTGQGQGVAPAATGSPTATVSSQAAGPVTATLPAATLTGAIPLGASVTAGTVLYAANGEPVVALLGEAVFWRDLQVGVADGNDVLVLETNLRAMGYGAALTVDTTYTSATASAVERWEDNLGRSDPDGTVALGDVVVVGSATQVSAQLVQPGDTLRAGAGVLTLSSTEQIVAGHVSARDVTAWAPGTAVTLRWSDGATAAATIASTGRDVVDGTVAFAASSAGAAPGRVSGTAVTVSLTTQGPVDALAVPVSAIRSGQGGRATVMLLDGTTEREVAVTTGIVAGGWVEVSGSLAAGQQVVLPG